jgi:Mg2+ and Co2+ transporter CorA
MEKENKKSIMEKFEQIRKQLQSNYDILDGLLSDCEIPYSEALDEIQNQQPKVKLKKKDKKELFLKILNEKMPNFVKALEEFDMMIEAIGWRIGDTLENLQEKVDKMDEIVELQEELEDRKRELDNY